MNQSNKRMKNMDGEQSAKRVKKECSYGASCYRMNPAHFREYSHPHLESILDAWNGEGEYQIPEQFSLQRSMLTEQLNVLVEKKLYERRTNARQDSHSVSSTNTEQNQQGSSKQISQDRNSVSQTETTQNTLVTPVTSEITTQGTRPSVKSESAGKSELLKQSEESEPAKKSGRSDKLNAGSSQSEKSVSRMLGLGAGIRDSSYRPVVPPARRAEDFLAVVRPRGLMRRKHEAAAPYHVFYTTIAAEPKTHSQPYSVTFLELLDASLGELHSSLQVNFMVEPGWLLAQYYFAGYSAKRLTILYGEECDDMKQLDKKPHVDAHRVHMSTPFGKHHTKLMLLCYEDGSVRVAVSTANLYADDWENRTQGLWLSPACPPLPAQAPAHAGESPTQFKRSLLKYLAHYRMPQLVQYVERVKRCDFTQVNVFLVASVPGSHFDLEWGMARAGALLRQHCAVPAQQASQWPLTAQASSLGSYGADPKSWLTGDFLHQFTKSKHPPQTLAQPPPLQLIYPSLGEERAALARRATGRRVFAVRGRLPRPPALAQRLPVPVARRRVVPQPRHAARQVVRALPRRARRLLPADVRQRQQGGVGHGQQREPGPKAHELRGRSHVPAYVRDRGRLLPSRGGLQESSHHPLRPPAHQVYQRHDALGAGLSALNPLTNTHPLTHSLAHERPSPRELKCIHLKCRQGARRTFRE